MADVTDVLNRTGARTDEAAGVITDARDRVDALDDRIIGLVQERMAVSAVIQPRGEHLPDLEELRTFLRRQLSGYKLPRSVTFVAEIPRSATGKANYPVAKEIASGAVTTTGVRA